MKIPQYENQVGPGRVQAAQGQLHGPNPAAFGGQLAQAGENMGRSLLHAAGAANQIADTLQRQHNIQQAENQRALERQEQRERNLRKTSAILNWRRENDELLNGKMNEDGSRVEGGLLTTEYGAAAGITKTYDEQARGIMKKYLDTAPTEEEREEWALAFQQDFQNNFDTVAKHQYKQQRAQGNLMTKAYLSQQEGLAGAVRTPEQMRANLDNSYKEYSDNAKANAVPAEQQKLARYGIAGKNVKASVEGNVFNDDLLAARNVLESAKDDLLPDDYNQLNAFIKQAQAAAEKGKKEDLIGLYQWAFEMAAENPSVLQEAALHFRQNPAKYQAEISDQLGTPIDAKKLTEFFNWVQPNLLDNPATTSGQQRRENFAQAETVYKSFNIGDKNNKSVIRNKDYDNTESLYTAVTSLNDGLKNGRYTKTDTETVDKYRADLMRRLGQKVQDANYSHNLVWDATCEKMMQNEIAQFAKGADLPAEATAEIYLKARELAARQNLDLSQDYQDENADQLEKVLSVARKSYYFRTYGVPMDQADAFVYDNKLVELQKQSKAQRSAYIKEVVGAAQKYAAENYNGQNARVARDKNGNITSVYFDKGTN